MVLVHEALKTLFMLVLKNLTKEFQVTMKSLQKWQLRATVMRLLLGIVQEYNVTIQPMALTG